MELKIFSSKFWITLLLLMFFMCTLMFGYWTGHVQTLNSYKQHYGLQFECYDHYNSKTGQWSAKQCNANISIVDYNYTVSLESNFNNIKFLDEIK